MVSSIKTFAFVGIEAIEVQVQVKISTGIVAFSIVGLPDKSLAESRERVIAAISSLGLALPGKRITVNLAPADLQKEGVHFDLPIAIGIMVEMGIITQESVNQYFILGELALDGSISSINGILAAAITANQKKLGLICPANNGTEAVWAGKDLEIIAPNNLLALINHLKGEENVPKPVIDSHNNNFIHKNNGDFAEVKGNIQAKRAVEIAASGNHNLLMIGPPGSGKSMISSRIPTILPPLKLTEILEINIIHSVSGKISGGKLITNRPFREVHHSCSMPAMVGGGTKAKPGEISLAHKGILFLDELAEFSQSTLESLRQPMESGKVDISRVNSHITYPADFQLIAAMNPCRCGYLGNPKKECRRAPVCGEEYQRRISGPIFDRIDIIINVEQIDPFDSTIFHKNDNSEDSASILARVVDARKFQQIRYQNHYKSSANNSVASNFNSNANEHSLNKDFLHEDSFILNGRLSGELLNKFCFIDPELTTVLQNISNKQQLSMRAINKILRVARTIADLEQSEDIAINHLLEASSYRYRGG